MSTFNGTFEVNACVANSIACSVKSLIEQAIRTCGEKYEFNVDEALEMLKISEVKMVTQKKAEKKAKAEKKTVIPLPFCGMINDSCCLGLIPNHGLYTQCPKARDDIALYCIKCNKEALANENEKPNSGDVRDRLSDNFVPPNKNKLTPYVKIMKKLNLTREQVETAALEQGITLPESCFVVPEKKSAKVEKMQKSRGRPKKDEIFVELNDTDLFSQQVLNQLKDEDNETTVSSLTDGIKDAEKQEKKPRVKLSQEEKEAKKQAQEAKKQEREAKKQEREAKKLSKAIEKPLAVVESVQEEPKPVEIIVEPIVEMEQIVEEDEPEKLKKFKFADTLYFKGEKSGMIYDYAVTKQRNEVGLDPIQIGVWNKKDKKIDFVKVEENNEEEEEDEYESDDE